MEDESVFRRDMELYLLQSMQKDVEQVVKIRLESAPIRRKLQQATLLEYQGVAVLESEDIFGILTTLDIQMAQVQALEDTTSLQTFLTESSTQPLNVLQVKVGERFAVTVEPSQPTDPPGGGGDDDKKSKAGLIVAVVGVCLLVIALVGFLVHRQWGKRPPPPPPYELEETSDGDSQDRLFPFKPSTDVGTFVMDESDTESPVHKPQVPKKEKSLYSDPIMPMGNSISIQEEADGMEITLSPLSNDPAVIDLTRPARNADGIQFLIKELPKPTEVEEMTPPPPPPPPPQPTTTDQLQEKQVQRKAAPTPTPEKQEQVQSKVPTQPPAPKEVPQVEKEATKAEPAAPTQQQEKEPLQEEPTDEEDESVLASIHSFETREDDDSMMGFSLATVEKPEKHDGSIVLTPPRPVINEQQQEESSPDVQNNPQLRWFEQPQTAKHHSQESYFSSDSESYVTLDEVSNPLRNSETGAEVEQDLFLDDDNNDTDEDFYSSHKEDDDSLLGGSLGGSAESATYTETSDSEVYNAGPTIDDKYGALGYFRRESDDEDALDDYSNGMIPQVTPNSAPSRAQDTFSDAPSDERTDTEQNLSGFHVPGIQKGSDRYTSNSLSSPDRPFLPHTTMSSPEYRQQPHVIPNNASWEDDPELVEHFLRERRRIKRAARKQRAERKQPPVTMEV